VPDAPKARGLRRLHVDHFYRDWGVGVGTVCRHWPNVMGQPVSFLWHLGRAISRGSLLQPRPQDSFCFVLGRQCFGGHCVGIRCYFGDVPLTLLPRVRTDAHGEDCL